MALRRLFSEVALRCGAAPSTFALRSLAVRGYSTVEKGLLYAKSHEWAKVEGDTATIGISDFAQEELGDVVYVELPAVGSDVTKGETFGVVESAASDVYSPVSGTVTEINNALVDDPAKVNSSAFTDGWMLKVKLTDKDTSGLLDDKAYEEFCAAGGH
ncbi:hypothetical protein N2152v2_008789 [Parachlorella kessleri]